MKLELYWTDLKIGKTKGEKFIDFVQKQANRLIVGIHRYDKGKPTVAAKYLTRAKAELKAYEKSGNQEYLINAANYCFLETVAPEHENSYFSHESKSVTRNTLGMKF